MKQPSFSSLAYSTKKKTTRRERFLAEMDQVIPWVRLLKVVRRDSSGARSAEGSRRGPAWNRGYLPEEVDRACAAVPSDLLVYPGDLRWRCAESVGDKDEFLSANDTGPYASNHSREGLFIRHDPERPGTGRGGGAHILDIAPTLLVRLELTVPGCMTGALRSNRDE